MRIKFIIKTKLPNAPPFWNPIAIEPALTIIKLSLKFAKSNETLARAFNNVLQTEASESQDTQTGDKQNEDAANDEVNDAKVEKAVPRHNVNLQLLRTNYGNNNTH